VIHLKFEISSKYRLINIISMKVSASVKPRCQKCRIIVRRNKPGKVRRVRVICSNPRHKQRQG